MDHYHRNSFPPCLIDMVSEIKIKMPNKIRQPASSLNSLWNNKLFTLSKFKAVAESNLKLAKTAKFFFRKVENIMGKGENASYLHFLYFQ